MHLSNIVDSDTENNIFKVKSSLLPVQIFEINLKISYEDGRRDRIIQEDFSSTLQGKYTIVLFLILFAAFLSAHLLLLYLDYLPAINLSSEKHYIIIKALSVLPFLSSILLIVDLNYLSFVEMGMYFLSLQENKILLFYLVFLVFDGIAQLFIYSNSKNFYKSRKTLIAYFILMITGVATGKWQNIFYIPLMLFFTALAAVLFSYMNKAMWKQTFAELISLLVKPIIIFTVIINAAFYLNLSMHPVLVYFLLLPVVLYYYCIYAIIYRKTIRCGQIIILLSILLCICSIEFSINHLVPRKAMGLTNLGPYVYNPYTVWIREELLGPDYIDNYYLTYSGFYNKYKKIICFGGSSTEGGVQMFSHGFRYDFPYQMDKVLKDYEYSVINYGVGGWTTFNIKNYIKHYTKVIDTIKPKVAIFYIGNNDVKDRFGPLSAEELWMRNNQNIYHRHLELLLERSNICFIIIKTISKIKKQLNIKSDNFDQSVPIVSPVESNKNILEIINILKERNIKILLVTEIEISTYEHTNAYYRDMKMFHKLLKRLSDNQYVYFIDATGYFQQFSMDSIMIDEVHLTEKGNKLLSDYLIKYLIENNLIEK